MAYGRKFVGRYEHTIDVKGRVMVPARYRESLAPFPTLTIDEDHLSIYPEDAWDEVMELYDMVPEDDYDAQRLVRYKIANAFEAEVDKQGRLLIPQYLREAAGLNREIVFVGMGKRVEIWDREVYAAENLAVKEQESVLRKSITQYREKLEERRQKQ